MDIPKNLYSPIHFTDIQVHAGKSACASEFHLNPVIRFQIYCAGAYRLWPQMLKLHVPFKDLHNFKCSHLYTVC